MTTRKLAVVCAVVTALAVSPGVQGANEGVCDVLLSSTTPGLYGLCVGFCEGQECVPDFQAPDPFGGCSPSSQRLLELYDERKQPGDPDMPCVAAGGCPCFDAEDVAGLPTPYDQCLIDHSFGGDELITNIIYEVPPNGTGAEARIGPFGSSCSFGDTRPEPDIFISLETTEAQAQACRQILVDHINANQSQCESLCNPVCQ